MTTPALSTGTELEGRCVNTIRTLAMDAVQAAGDGHPGTAMGLAPVAYALYQDVMQYDPTHPEWFDRDRFILSNGHASILQYSSLFLAGYDLPLDEIKRLRQWGSKTPGHPEVHHTPGVETTTGPLGNGFATGVGFALAERYLAARFNRPGHEVIDHRVFATCSDGDLMEGVASEAASLAGHLRLGKLIYVYDDNDITIDGKASISFTEDVDARFGAYGWHVQALEGDGNDLDAIRAAIRAAIDDPRPSFIRIQTHIAYGAPDAQDTSPAHGSALGEDEVRATKIALGLDPDQHFLVTDEVRAHMDRRADGAAAREGWEARMAAYAEAFPDLHAELTRAIAGDLPDGWDADLPTYSASDGKIATRKASSEALNAIANRMPLLIGGSGDLAGSNSTALKDLGRFTADDVGQQINFGIREHAMGAAANGINMHGATRGFSATFLIFSDYQRPTIRLAGLMRCPTIFIYTHDSVGLGGDGPTHQPVEHLTSLRAIPNLVTWRPADATEAVEAWRAAITRLDGPTALVFSRQGLPVLDRDVVAGVEEFGRGAYVLADPPDGEAPRVVLLASGSEVHVALDAQRLLADDRIPARVVSVPSLETFMAQDRAYRDEVLIPSLSARVAVEAGATLSWWGLVGLEGRIVGIDHYGASAPGDVALREFGFTPERVATAARETLDGSNGQDRQR